MVQMREGKEEAIKTYERGFPVGEVNVSHYLDLKNTIRQMMWR